MKNSFMEQFDLKFKTKRIWFTFIALISYLKTITIKNKACVYDLNIKFNFFPKILSKEKGSDLESTP